MSQSVKLMLVSVTLGAELGGSGDGPRVMVSADDAKSLPDRVETPGGELALHHESLTPGGGLAACAACGHPELYTRKDFPRAVGIGLVVVAAVLAPSTWYISLGVAALIDFVLYRAAPNVVECYVCHSEHRGFVPDPRHPAFDREIDERLKFGKKAVMGKPMREGGTAGAPEPEH